MAKGMITFDVIIFIDSCLQISKRWNTVHEMFVSDEQTMDWR